MGSGARRFAAIVCEATGRLEAALVALLADAGLPIVVVDPRQVRDFACARQLLVMLNAIARSETPWTLDFQRRC